MVTARKKSPPGNGDSKGGFRAANNISPVSNLSWCSADHFHGFIKSKNWSTIYQKQYCRTTKVVFISLSDIFSSFSHFLQGTIRAGELLLFVQSLKTKSRHAFLSKICVYPILFVAWEVVRATCKGFTSDVTKGWVKLWKFKKLKIWDWAAGSDHHSK